MSKELLKRFEVLQRTMSPLMDEGMMTSSISEREDRSNTHYTDGRYLDAWARVLNIQAPCSAVVQVNQILYVSFNKVEKSANELALKNIEYGRIISPTVLLFVSFVFNRNVIDETKTQDSPYHKFFKQSLGKLLEAGKQATPLEAIRHVAESNIQEFFGIQQDIFKGDNWKLISVVLRINQDVIKLSKFHYRNVEIIALLDNPEKVHGELVVATKLALSGALPYIGISKLSCYLCHEALDYFHQEHRGTHGTLYLNGFNIPSIFDEEFIASCIEKIQLHRMRHWEEANQRITDNKHIITQKSSEEADLSDDEDIDQETLLINQFEGLHTLHDLKTFVSAKQTVLGDGAATSLAELD